MKPSMSMKQLTFATLVLLAPFVALPAANAPKPSTPNIVIIFIDDQGYGDIGPFGAKGYSTPNLDRMAAEGRKFTNFHVPQPVCSASRAGLLTGCYPKPHRHPWRARSESDARDCRYGNDDRATREAKGLRDRHGGQWHLARPNRFCRCTTVSTNTLACLIRTTCGPLHPEARPGTYPPLPLIEGDTVLKSDLGHEDQNQLTTQYTERAVKFIEKNKDRPFFFYLAHSMVHVPLHVSDKFAASRSRVSTATPAWKWTGAWAKSSRR